MKQEKNHMCLLTFSSTNNERHEVLLLHGGIHGGWTLYHSESQEGDEPSIQVNGATRCLQLLRNWLSWIQFILLHLDRLQLTAVQCNRRRVLTQHLKWPVFAMQCAENGHREKWQSQHTVWLQVQKWTKSENSIIGMLCLRGDDARYRHQWRHDHHDCFPHSTSDTKTWAHCLLYSACRHNCTPHRTLAQVRAVIHMRSWCVRFSLDFDLSLHLLPRTSCRTLSTSPPTWSSLTTCEFRP